MERSSSIRNVMYLYMQLTARTSN